MSAETLPQQLSDIDTQLTTVNQQLAKIGPASDAASLDALAAAVAILTAGQTAILTFLGLSAAPAPTPAPPPAPATNSWEMPVPEQPAAPAPIT